MSYNLHEINCPICGSKNYKVLLRHRDDHFLKAIGYPGAKVRVVACRRCGLVFQNPQIDLKTLEKVYPKNFRKDKALSEKYFRIIIPDAESKMKWIERNILNVEKGTVLDIGSAAGVLLNMFKEKGWNTFGVEPTVAFAQYSQEKYGLNVEIGFFQESTLTGIEFDLITISHVLEHIVNPIEFLLIARKKLKDNGYLYVEVPNIQKPKLRVLYSSFFASPHLFLFSPQTLKMVLAKAGFKIVAESDAERGFKVLAKKDKFRNEFNFSQEGDNYKKIFYNISKCRIKYFFTVSGKKLAKKFIRNSLIKVLGPARAQNLIRALKNGRHRKEKNRFNRREEESD